MQKLKKKLNNLNLLTYKFFLKNNNLKTKYKLKQNLFQNEILFKNPDSINIEVNKIQNYFLPFLSTERIIYTIQTQYENNYLLNYTFNYEILYYLTKLFIKKKKKKIQGKLINVKKTKIILSILGITFLMKLKHLCKNRRIFYGRHKKKKKKVLAYYKLKYLTFHIKKNFLSRRTYVTEIIEKKKKKNASI